MGWITHSAKGVGEVLRDYRNYIHPHKELSHGIPIETDDAVLLWEVSKTISRQVINSVPGLEFLNAVSMLPHNG